jgi:uncharacterized protein (DUF885 family)
LAEVARIEDRMQELVDEAGFVGSMREYGEYLRTDGDNFYKTEVRS